MQNSDQPPALERAVYVPPVLEALGEWSALTLQQTFVLTDDDAWNLYRHAQEEQ